MLQIVLSYIAIIIYNYNYYKTLLLQIFFSVRNVNYNTINIVKNIIVLLLLVL